MIDMLKKYQVDGYVVIDNFLPAEVADELNSMYCSEKNWEHIDQTRKEHYQHVFATKSLYLPKADESYRARFGRSRDLEKNIRLNQIYAEHFVPPLKQFSEADLKVFDVRCYQLKPGDFYRSHIDDYAGDIGCVYYINKKWIWDWGGLLHVNSYEGDADFVDTIFPKFNRAVFLDHKKFKFPHHVSVVAEYAKESRFSIVSFNG
jgi:Rps23 Pro-64 3,4-dihydroxylase Tpa1-like proline 4-hydroxylase